MIFTNTPRLILRAFKAKDASSLLDYLFSPRSPCFQDEKLNSLEDAAAEVDRRAHDNSQFAVCLKETDELIGHLFADNSEEPDRNTWSVGWHFNKRYEGQGYATESVTALFQYLFSEKEARRLYAYVEDYNLSSQKLCVRLHMRQEGCFKEFVSFIQDDGEETYDDTFIFALLKKSGNRLMSDLWQQTLAYRCLSTISHTDGQIDGPSRGELSDPDIPVCQKQTFLKQLCVNKVAAGQGLSSFQGCYGRLLVS